MNTVQCVRHRAFGTVRGTRIETQAVLSFTRGPILGLRTGPNARYRVHHTVNGEQVFMNI